MELALDLVELPIRFLGPPQDLSPLLSAKGFIEVMIDIGRLDECDIKNRMAAVATFDLTLNAIFVGVFHGFEDLVYLRHQGFIFPKYFGKIHDEQSFRDLSKRY
jgi:hypothetical protein